MIDAITLEKCRKDKEIRKIKIQSLEHAIKQSESMISESQMDANALTFLRRKIAESIQDLELLYLINAKDK